MPPPPPPRGTADAVLGFWMVACWHSAMIIASGMNVGVKGRKVTQHQTVSIKLPAGLMLRISLHVLAVVMQT